MEAFVRVVDAGSFTAAARAWSRSKGAVSKYVAELEAHLGVTLLRRSTRSMSLTDTGQRYYERCVELLGELDALDDSARDAHAGPHGWLRVTAPPGLVDRYLPLLTTELRRRFPSLRVELELTHRMADLVEERFDVAIRVTAPRDSSLIARKLAPAPLLAVASPAYLETHGAPRAPSDLATHACLVDTNFRDGARWRFRVDGTLETVRVDGPFRVNSPTAVRELAIAGHGIGLVPAFTVAEAIESGEVATVLEGMPAFDWAVYAVYPRRRHLSARVRAFVDHLVDGFADVQGQS